MGTHHEVAMILKESTPVTFFGIAFFTMIAHHRHTSFPDSSSKVYTPIKVLLHWFMKLILLVWSQLTILKLHRLREYNQ
jgi:hypothetical protein